MAIWHAVNRSRYLAREEVLNVVTPGFIGCYGDDRWSLRWICGTGGRNSRSSQLGIAPLDLAL